MENYDNSTADDIAATIGKILIKAFTDKEGREPTNEEIQMLFEEMTEERLESLLNGMEEPKEDDEEKDNDDAEDEADGEAADEVEEQAAEQTATGDKEKEEHVAKDSVNAGTPETNKRTIGNDVAANENALPSSENKKARVAKEVEAQA